MGPQATQGVDRKLQEVYEKQKYLVLGSIRDYKEGDIVTFIDWSIRDPGGDIRNDIPVRVIGNSTYEEMEAQFTLLGVKEKPDSLINYYRVIAE